MEKNVKFKRVLIVVCSMMCVLFTSCKVKKDIYKYEHTEESKTQTETQIIVTKTDSTESHASTHNILNVDFRDLSKDFSADSVTIKVVQSVDSTGTVTSLRNVVVYNPRQSTTIVTEKIHLETTELKDSVNVQTIDSVAVHTEDSKIKSTVIEKTKEVDMQSKGLPWYVYAILGAVIIVVFWIFIKRFIL